MWVLERLSDGAVPKNLGPSFDSVPFSEIDALETNSVLTSGDRHFRAQDYVGPWCYKLIVRLGVEDYRPIGKLATVRANKSLSCRI